MVFNATFNNISVISVAVSFIGGENESTRRKALSQVTDGIDSCKSKYYMIMTMMAPYTNI